MPRQRGWEPEAGSGVWVRSGQGIQSNPAEAWLSDGRNVLHFKPVIWRRSQQELEVTSDEWLSNQAAPLLKRRQLLSRE